MGTDRANTPLALEKEKERNSLREQQEFGAESAAQSPEEAARGAGAAESLRHVISFPKAPRLLVLSPRERSSASSALQKCLPFLRAISEIPDSLAWWTRVSVPSSRGAGASALG